MQEVELPPGLAVTAQVSEDGAQQRLPLLDVRVIDEQRPDQPLGFGGAALLAQHNSRKQARLDLGGRQPGGLTGQALALAKAAFEQGLATLPHEQPPPRIQRGQLYDGMR